MRDRDPSCRWTGPILVCSAERRYRQPSPFRRGTRISPTLLGIGKASRRFPALAWAQSGTSRAYRYEGLTLPVCTRTRHGRESSGPIGPTSPFSRFLRQIATGS